MALVKMTCIDKKLETLRKKRSELTEESSKIQKEIDDLIFEKYNFDPFKYINKIIKYYNIVTEEFIVLKVFKILRRTSYLEIVGSKLTRYYEDDSYKSLTFETSESIIISFERIKSIQIISKEEANQIIQNYFDQFKF